MIPEEISRMVVAGESETLEFKKTTGERNEAAKAVCAMLNHRGGAVLFGATPEGTLAGQEVGDGTIERVSAEVQRIEPPVFPSIERHPVDGTREVILIRVGSGSMKPYSYKGDAYRRVGNTSLRMSRDEYNRVLFERMHSEQRWENQPAHHWSIDDLDEEEIVVTVEEAIRQGRLEDPGTRDTGALCHRDYSLGGGSVGVGVYDDRLEVTSTGPLPFGQTPEQLFTPHESRPWNPLIADVFYRRGLIERWGRGTIKMAELTTAAGLPRPEIESATDYVTVRFRPSRYVPPQRVSIDLTDRQQAILALLHQSSIGLARREIHAQLGRDISDRTVQRDLNALRDFGMVVGAGRGRSARWKLV